MIVDYKSLLQIRNNDDLFFDYIVELTINLIIEEDDIAGLQIHKDHVKYILEFVFKACILSSYLLNDTYELEQPELLEYSKSNFERIKKYLETKPNSYNFLLDVFYNKTKNFLE
jgi:hypothetical protein